MEYVVCQGKPNDGIKFKWKYCNNIEEAISYIKEEYGDLLVRNGNQLLWHYRKEESIPDCSAWHYVWIELE